MSGINELIEVIRKEGSRGYVEIRYSSWVKFLCEGYVTDVGDGPQTHNHNIRSNKLKKGDTVLIKYDEDRVLIIDRVVL